MKLDHLWRKVHAMSSAEIEAFAEKHKVDMTQEFDDQAHAAAFLCAELGIQKDEGGAGADLDEEINEYARKHGGTYSEALAALSKDPGFRKRWTLIFQ
jgi:hypothetical protein